MPIAPRSFAIEHLHDSIKSPMSDKIEGDETLAVQIPLIPLSEKTKTAAEILTDQTPNKLVYLQLPSTLPIIYPNENPQMAINPLIGAADGFLGQIQVHQSGKVTAKIGNVNFLIEDATPPSCRQLFCIKVEDGIKYVELPREKIMMTLDLDKTFQSIEQEEQEDDPKA